MTRKQLPRAIARAGNDLAVVAAGAMGRERSKVFEVELESENASRPAANGDFQARTAFSGRGAVKRRRLARKIVQRHETYAAIGGLLPLPIASVAGVTAIIMRMARQLSALYGVPFEHEQTRSAIVGLVGGSVPAGVGAATASTMAFVFPGSAIAGLAVSAFVAGAVTRGIGLVFLEHFEAEVASH